MDIRRGIIRQFDSGTYLADVQIVGSMATMLTGVPVAKQIGADLVTSGIKCGVLFFDETNPADACVAFLYGEAHPGHITIPQGKEFRPGGDANTAFGENGSGNAYLKDAIAGTKTLSELAAGGGNPQSLDVLTSDLEVVNTSNETSIYSFTVPGGTLGTNNLLRLRIYGRYYNNTGAARTLTVRLKYGATTLVTQTVFSLTWADVAMMPMMEIFLKGDGATNSQRAVVADGWMTRYGGGSYGYRAYGDEGTAAEDSTADKTLEVTIQHSAAHASLAFSRRAATLEKMAAL